MSSFYKTSLNKLPGWIWFLVGVFVMTLFFLVIIFYQRRMDLAKYEAQWPYGSPYARSAPPPTPVVSVPDIVRYNRENKEANIENCPIQGIDQNKNNLYEKYVAQEGDTLQSIANSQLGDPSRIGDLYYINRQTYPGLSMNGQEIEPGWVIYLPPAYFKSVEFAGRVPKLIYAESGRITHIVGKNNWIIYLDQSNAAREMNVTGAVFINKKQSLFRVGDCITTINQEMGNKIYAVFAQ